MATARVHVGVDVSKENLDVYMPGGKTVRTGNTVSAVRRLVRGVKAKDPSAMFCCESTGGYERTLVDVCREEGQPVCVMNALQCRRYAEHRGMLEKTDRIDARVISMAADDKNPAALIHPGGRQRKLKEMWTLRTHLASQRDGERNRLEHLHEKEAVAAVKRIIASYERQIERLEKLCRDEVSQEEKSQTLLDRFQIVKGVGPLTALALVALLPELLFLDDKRLSKLAGVAPICDQSGTLDGPRHIMKGRGLVRRALYWAAVSASQHNKILAAFYNRRVEGGKAKTVALVAVMRKLLCLVRRIAQNPEFVPAEG